MSRKDIVLETRVHWGLRNLDDRQADRQHQGSGFQHHRGKVLPVGRKKSRILISQPVPGKPRQGLVGGIT